MDDLYDYTGPALLARDLAPVTIDGRFRRERDRTVNATDYVLLTDSRLGSDELPAEDEHSHRYLVEPAAFQRGRGHRLGPDGQPQPV